MYVDVETELQPGRFQLQKYGAALTWAAQHDVDAAAFRDDVVGHRLDRFTCTLVGEITATKCAVLHDLPHTRPIGEFEENHRHLLARRKHRLGASGGILGGERGMTASTRSEWIGMNGSLSWECVPRRSEAAASRKPATISCYMGRLSAGYQSDGTIHGSERPLHLFMAVDSWAQRGIG